MILAARGKKAERSAAKCFGYCCARQEVKKLKQNSEQDTAKKEKFKSVEFWKPYLSNAIKCSVCVLQITFGLRLH